MPGGAGQKRSIRENSLHPLWYKAGERKLSTDSPSKLGVLGCEWTASTWRWPIFDQQPLRLERTSTLFALAALAKPKRTPEVGASFIGIPTVKSVFDHNTFAKDRPLESLIVSSPCVRHEAI